MRRTVTLLILSLSCGACAPSQFATWQQENFETTPITQSQTKVISFRNPISESVQTLLGVGFDGKGDGRQHFRIDKVMVGNRVVGQKEIVVPPGSSLNIQVTYEPRNLETTQASFGGWVTGVEERFVPYDPDHPPQPKEEELAIHRVVLLAVYDYPQGGIAQVELVGKSVPGPDGEISLPEIGAGECEAGGGRACFTGNFSIDVPKLFATGPQEQSLVGPIRFQIAGASATLHMEDVPPIILILRGNGPGEPLEGQPVNAVSIAIRGFGSLSAAGTFDGSQLELQGLAFRVQVFVGELGVEDILTISPIVDFTIEDLMMTTEVPYTDGRITLLIDTTLSEKPAGNPLFDDFLGGAQILVRFLGELAL